MRKVFLLCCLAMFCVSVFEGCTPPPGKSTPAKTTEKAPKSVKKK